MKINRTPRKKKEKVEKEISIFEFLNDITRDKKFILNEDNDRFYKKYLICRWLSSNWSYLKVSDILNRYQGVLDNYEFHKFAMLLIPTKRTFKRNYNPFSKPLLKEIKEDLVYISRYFETTERESYEYYITIPENERPEFIKKLKKIYGIVK